MAIGLVVRWISAAAMRLRRLLEDDGVADHAGEEDDQHDHADIGHRLHRRRLQQPRPGQLAVGEDADERGVDDGEGTDLGGREEPAADGDEQRQRERAAPISLRQTALPAALSVGRLASRSGSCAAAR